MYKKLFTTISTKVLSNDKAKKSNRAPDVFKEIVEVIDDRSFVQSGSFRGYKRYRLTTYKEPGVSTGIEFFRNKNADFLYEIERGLPVRLLIKRIINEALGERYKVLEVYIAGHKVGVLYNGNAHNDELFSKPFDKVHVRIEGPETIIHKNGVEYRAIVYLFVHYSE